MVMRIFDRTWLLMAFLGISGFTEIQGQLQHSGVYKNLISSRYMEKSQTDKVKSYQMPLLNNEELEAKVLAEEQDEIYAKIPTKVINSEDNILEVSFGGQLPKARPYVFGAASDLSLNMTNVNDGEWIIDEENRIRTWRFKVKSVGALTISIYFSDFHLAPGGELYVIGREETLGAFTSENNNDYRVFGISPVFGDYLILEYVEPIRELRHGHSSSIVVQHVVHAFRSNPFSTKSARSSSGSCNINVACPEGHGKVDMINSVALILNTKGTGLCTGTMINNSKNDAKQLLLSAEHCLKGEKAEKFIIGFEYQYRYCNSFLESKPKIKTVHGVKLLGSSKRTDYALFEISEKIPDDWNVYLSGWDANPSTSRNGNFFSIHHPNGDVKKVSTYLGNIDLVRLVDVGQGSNFWRIPRWAKGTTEPGSSGSALFDSQGYLIGHLLGGESSCSRTDYPDYFGALSKDWAVATPSISSFLDPVGISVLRVSGAYLKDLRSKPEGDTESPSEDDDEEITTVTVTATSTVTATVVNQSPPETITVTAPPTSIYITQTVTVPKSTITLIRRFKAP